MVVNTEIQKDARVLRAAKALNCYDIVMLSMNGDKKYQNPDFLSIIYENKKDKGFRLNIAFWFFVIKYCIRHKKEFSLFYFHDYPMVATGWVAATICRKPWVYDAHELLVNHRSYKTPWRRKFYIFLERISIKHADLVIAANYERERIIRHLYNLKNTINIRNIADIHVSVPDQKESFVVFQGAIAKDRDLHPFIDSIRLLPDSIKLKIIGGGEHLSLYEEYVKENNLDDRVFFTGSLPYEELMKESAKGKIGIIVYQMDGLNYIYCEPNKIYEYASTRLPMLVSPQPNLKHLVSKYHVGEVLEYPIKANDVAAKIQKIMAEYESYLVGFKTFTEDYSFEKETLKLQGSIKSLLEK